MSIRGARVLVIEDDPEDFELASELLAALGVGPVVWEPDGTRALGALQETDCDVCLLDLHLGAVHGIDLIRQAVSTGVTMPIILLTGASDWQVERHAMEVGASDFMLKGAFTAAMLERSIRHSIDRARAQATTRVGERRFRLLFERSRDATLIANELGYYVDANRAALELFGVSRDELLLQSVRTLGGSGTGPKLWDELARAEYVECDVTICRPDGGVRVAELRAANFTPGQYVAVLRDVTERRRTEQQRMQLSAVVEAVHDGIFGLTTDGMVSFWSASAQRMYGYTSEEALGRSRSVLVVPGEDDELAGGLDRVLAGTLVSALATTCQRRDGSIFHASMSLSPIRANAAVVGIAVVTRDVSDQKRLQHQLAMSDRMASVGMLAAGVAHEINNPLVAVTAHVELALERLATVSPPIDGHVLALLEDARTGAGRITRIVRDLSLFSHPGDDGMGAVDINQVLESAARIAWNEISHRARLVRELGAAIPVFGNEPRLGQVFLNLIVNATHAIAEGNVTGNEIRLVSRVDAEGRVVVEVCDTGSGIAPHMIPRLFEPFYTSKRAGKGTGLGLTICQRIVAEHGGRIGVTSTVGVGTTVTVTLPPALAVVPIEKPAPVEVITPAAAQILVVDDEPTVIAAVEYSLQRTHAVTAAHTAADALARITAGARFDLILCDLMMPQMTGMELYSAIEAVAPEQAAAMVFLTGGAFTTGAERFLSSIPNTRFDKPFGSAQLRALVNEWLHANRGRTTSVTAATAPTT